MAETIDDIFEESQEDEEKDVEESESQADEETKAKETSEDTEDDGDKPGEKSENQTVPREALIAERKKRQALEKALSDVQAQQPDQNEPDPIDDPEGYKKYIINKARYDDRKSLNDRSRNNMINEHDDYEEKEKHFLIMAQTDPTLVARLNEAFDPARFAYETAKADMDSLKEKTRSEIEAEILDRLKREGKLKDEKEVKKVSAEVSALLKSTGAGKNTDDLEELPEDPGDFFD